MNTATGGHRAAAALGGLAVAGAWTSYLPVGAKYAVLLGCAAAALGVLRSRAAIGTLWRAPTARAAGALLAWLALTALWSPAPWPHVAAALWTYALPVLVPLIASACPAPAARRALRHFALCSAAVGVLFVLDRAQWLPTSELLWHTTLQAEGNQRIATSILLAVGGALSLWFGLQAGPAARSGWLVAALACCLGLALQDRRTGMLLLPVLLLAWALVRQPVWWRRLAVAAAVLLAAAGAWQASDGVRQRFAEGLAELRQYPADDRVASSWGQRLRMWELTGAMIQQRPLAGHGAGSWRTLWQGRVTPGTPLAANSTPHSEYLLLAQQAGAVGLALWLWLLASGVRHAARHAAAGVPALLAWTAIAWTGLFNAVNRDAKFALPLLLLAALAVAAARDTEPAETAAS